VRGVLFITNVPKISENGRFICDETITIDECSKALSRMNVNKSPGTDGFTVEFYKYFWDDIKHYVFESLQHAFVSGYLSCEQRRGVLRLIPKK